MNFILRVVDTLTDYIIILIIVSFFQKVFGILFKVSLQTLRG